MRGRPLPSVDLWTAVLVILGSALLASAIVATDAHFWLVGLQDHAAEYLPRPPAAP